MSATVFQWSVKEKSKKITFTSSTNQLSRALPVPRHWLSSQLEKFPWPSHPVATSHLVNLSWQSEMQKRKYKREHKMGPKQVQSFTLPLLFLVPPRLPLSQFCCHRVCYIKADLNSHWWLVNHKIENAKTIVLAVCILSYSWLLGPVLLLID